MHAIDSQLRFDIALLQTNFRTFNRGEATEDVDSVSELLYEIVASSSLGH